MPDHPPRGSGTVGEREAEVEPETPADTFHLRCGDVIGALFNLHQARPEARDFCDALADAMQDIRRSYDHDTAAVRAAYREEVMAMVEGMRKTVHDSCCERVVRAIDGHCDCTHPGWNAALDTLAAKLSEGV